ncbi:MAG: 5-(carboxyamino)imidazole ribonucleotide synthase [Bacteroidetes bacterium]|jgi:5-(carboxyamino)imidazole ribonucleotide synthase|nr:5-(carboxyamino)imidazole ribonucleotide synthase [Bacteroidota bacterium]MDA0972114.1 5-(carboxyamino)imidazole ribonucleotide synthase [Bacteroidota bacterium]
MRKVAVLGGGQLGMMMQEASANLPLELHFLDPDSQCSVASLTPHLVEGSFTDESTVMDFCRDMDLITVEIEHVNLNALHTLVAMGKEVYPQPTILDTIIDKGLQKEFFDSHGFPTAPYELLNSGHEALERGWIPPFVLKSRTGGYDGKGVQIIRNEEDMARAFQGPCVIEAMAPIQKELAVIASRDVHGKVSTFPLVEMDFDPDLNLVRALFSPAQVSKEISQAAKSIAKRLVEEWELVGNLAVEFFLNENGSLWVNEVAPRPHNSGHHTIEANETSQFEQHLRAIAGLGLGSTALKRPAAMVNILGAPGHSGKAILRHKELLKGDKEVFLHEYHKSETRPGRKMAHLTVCADSSEAALKKALELGAELSYEAESSSS